MTTGNIREDIKALATALGYGVCTVVETFDGGTGGRFEGKICASATRTAEECPNGFIRDIEMSWGTTKESALKNLKSRLVHLNQEALHQAQSQVRRLKESLANAEVEVRHLQTILANHGVSTPEPHEDPNPPTTD